MLIFIFAVEVEFAADVYVAEENDMGGISITLVARGDLSSEFTIPVTVIGGTAMRTYTYYYYRSECAASYYNLVHS